MKYQVGETESFFLDEDGGGTVINEQTLRDVRPSIEQQVAEWREARFGIPPSAGVVFQAWEQGLGVYYLNGHHGGTLPPGSDRCWARGIWVPVSWGYADPHQWL